MACETASIPATGFFASSCGLGFSGSSVFAAFGAQHLSGDNGVLNLLQAEGFTLEELPL